MAFGKWLGNELNRRRMTAYQLAKSIPEMSESQISDIIREDRDSRASTIEKICSVLGCRYPGEVGHEYAMMDVLSGVDEVHEGVFEDDVSEEYQARPKRKPLSSKDDEFEVLLARGKKKMTPEEEDIVRHIIQQAIDRDEKKRKSRKKE